MAVRRTLILMTVTATLLTARPAFAVKVADITRLSGQRPNVLTGLGLVVGLKGTGDGGAYLPAIKPLAGMVSRVADPTTGKGLGNVDNVALVLLSAKVPANGVRDRGPIDVHVMSQGAAESPN